MHFVITGIVIIFNMILFLKKREYGLAFYCVLAVCYPLTTLSGMKISYEILGGTVLIAEELVRYLVFKSFKMYKSYFILAFIIIVYCVMTFLSSIFWKTSVLYVTLAGVIRLGVLLVIFTQGDYVRIWWRNILKYSIIINSVAIGIQIFVPNSWLVFMKYYQKGEIGVYSSIGYMWGGVFKRCYGTFATPSLLAILAACSTICFLCEIVLEKEKKDSVVCFVLSIICGMASAMKQYYVGVASCLVAGIFVAIIYKLVKKITIVRISKSLKKLGISIIICAVMIPVLDGRGVLASSYFKAAFNVDRLVAGLDIRYNKENGYASAGMNMEEHNKELADKLGIEYNEKYENPVLDQSDVDALDDGDMRQQHYFWVVEIIQKLFGVGATAPEGKSIIDSQWSTFLWYYGLVNTILVVGWLLQKVYVGFRTMNFENLCYILLLGVLGIVTLSITNFLGILNLAYIAKNKIGFECHQIMQENFKI